MLQLGAERGAGEDGLSWTLQFRDIEALWRMIERVGERPALAFFASNLHEQVQAGKVQEAEAAAACRMLDQAGYPRYCPPRRCSTSLPSRQKASTARSSGCRSTSSSWPRTRAR